MSKEKYTIYTFLEEPTNNIYHSLLKFALGICDRLLLICRPGEYPTNSLEPFLDEMQPYLINKKKSLVWPGTQLGDGTGAGGADLRFYYFNEATYQILVKWTKSLYEWLAPVLPEDLCILRGDESPWLVTISHERDSYLEITDAEYKNLLEKIPDIEKILVLNDLILSPEEIQKNKYLDLLIDVTGILDQRDPLNLRSKPDFRGYQDEAIQTCIWINAWNSQQDVLRSLHHGLTYVNDDAVNPDRKAYSKVASEIWEYWQKVKDKYS